MIRPLLQVEALLPSIESGRLILTPNNRLRNQIKTAYQAHLGDKVMPSPRVMSLREWQQHHWHQLQNVGFEPSLRLVANPSQLSAVWQSVIAEVDTHSGNVRSQLEIQALARQLQEAFSYLIAWQQPTQSNAFDNFVNRCFQLFEQRLAKINWLTEEQALPIIIDGFQHKYLTPETDVVLLSFIDIQPLSQQLIDCAFKHTTVLSAAAKGSAVYTEAEDSAGEIKAAAQWSWQILQNQPSASIAIIAPQLARDRAQIESQLCEVFESHQFDPQQECSALPFNISAAQNLAQVTFIVHGLKLLECQLDQLPVDNWISILHSPFFGDRESENALRTRLCEKIKARQTYHLTLQNVCDLAQKCIREDNDPACKQLIKTLQNLLNQKRRQKQNQPPSYWANFFLQQLQSLEWPGTRKLDSVEYQAMQHWYILLEDFAALDSLQTPLALQDALFELKKLAQQSLFQTETRDTPIHVLGAFEAVGLHFSHCWVLGMNDREWPTPLKPNPLLPKHVQWQWQMPRASLQREMEIAKELTDYFLRAGDIVIVSYAKQDGEEHNSPSALIRDLPFETLENIVSTNTIGLDKVRQVLTEPANYTWVQCDHGLPWQTDDVTKGGQTLFKLQAQCPFNAYAQLRLHTKPTEPAKLGWGPREKGIIIHQVLAGLWEQLGNQQQLIELTADEKQTLVRDITARCCLQQERNELLLLGDTYYQLEQERIAGLILAWLQQELLRPPFTVIATEQNLQADFAGLQLQLQIDRVDQLDDGSLLLIDYKTGNPTTNAWLQERPSEPQLPLYALCYEQSVEGIAFAKINSENIGLSGIANDNNALSIDGIKSTAKVKVEDWPALLAEFERKLTTLAQEFLAGACRVEYSQAQNELGDPFAPLNRANESDFIQYWWQQNS